MILKSTKERNLIELASIVALEPKLAILDEPDSGIDMLSIQDIISVINVLKKNGACRLKAYFKLTEINEVYDEESKMQES